MLALKIFARKILSFSALLFIVVYLPGCGKGKDGQVLTTDKEIISFSLQKADGSTFNISDINVTINADTVKVTLPATTNLNGLIPTISTNGVSISPASGVAQDFSKPVAYTVKAEDGSTKTYLVIAGLNGITNMVYVGSSDNNFYALDAQTGKLVWQYTGGGWFSYASPAMYNGIVYAGCTDNNLYAFDALTGNVIWKFTTGGPIESSLSVVDGVIYTGSDDHNMYALDAATGKLKWSYTTGSNVSSSPAVLNGVVYFGSSDAQVYALNITNGSLVWKFSANEMINQSGAAISNGIVFIGSRDGNLYAINAATGNLKWKYNTNGISLEQSSPTISNGIVYIGGWYDISNFSRAGSVYAVDENTGTVIWQSLESLGFSSSPYIFNNTLYISADDGNFYSLNAATGATNWSRQIYPNSAGATVANGIVYVGGGGTHYIYALDAASGKDIWKFEVGSNGLSSSSPCVVGTNGVVYNSGASGQQF